MKSSNIIVINGRRYDAHTGESIDQVPEHRARAAVHRKPEHAHEPKTHHVSPIRHEHQRARHAAPHAPAHSTTLMRQAVKKPEADAKRRIKVQGRLNAPAAGHNSRILSRSGTRQPNLARLQNPATKRPKGQLISHFSPELFSVDKHTPAMTYGAVPVSRAAARPAAKPTSRKKDWTTDELLEYAVHHTAAPRTDMPARPRRKMFIRRAHAGRH